MKKSGENKIIAFLVFIFLIGPWLLIVGCLFISKVLLSNIFSLAYCTLLILSVLSLTCCALCLYLTIIRSKKKCETACDVVIESKDNKKIIDMIQQQMGNHISSVNTALTIISVLVLAISVAIPIMNYAWINSEVVDSLIIQVDNKIKEVEDSTEIQYQLTLAKTNISYSEKKQIYDRLVKNYPANKEVYIQRANFYYVNSNYESSISDYLQAESLGANDTTILSQIGNAYNNQRNLKGALRYYNKALKIALQNGENIDYLYNNIGLAYSKSNEEEVRQLALEYYDKAIAVNDKYSSAFGNKGTFLYEEKRFPESLECLNKAIQYDNKDKYSYRYRALVFTQLKKYDDALNDYNQAIAIDPKYTVVYRERGWFFYTINEKDKALADYNKAIELYSKHSGVFCDRGTLYHNCFNEPDKALADFNKSIYLDAENAVAYNNRGWLYEDKFDDMVKALADYTRTIELDPKYALAYKNRGRLYYTMDEKDKALKDYNKAIELDPINSNYYFCRGVVYHQLGKLEDALTDYNKAITINQDYGSAYCNRAVIFYKLGHIDSAIKDIDRAIELDPTDDIINANSYLLHLYLTDSAAIANKPLMVKTLVDDYDSALTPDN